LPPLKGYYADFSQGFFNLIQNALEAMEKSSPKELTLITEKSDDQLKVGCPPGMGYYFENPSIKFSRRAAFPRRKTEY